MECVTNRTAKRDQVNTIIQLLYVCCVSALE